MKSSKLIYKMLSIVIFLRGASSYSQTNSCDTIYTELVEIPKYEQGTVGLSHYFTNELLPIIVNFVEPDADIMTGFIIILTIDKNGKVIEATFPKSKLTGVGEEKLKEKLLGMTNWIAGKENEISVCSTFIWPITCIKWE